MGLASLDQIKSVVTSGLLSSQWFSGGPQSLPKVAQVLRVVDKRVNYFRFDSKSYTMCQLTQQKFDVRPVACEPVMKSSWRSEVHSMKRGPPRPPVFFSTGR